MVLGKALRTASVIGALLTLGAAHMMARAAELAPGEASSQVIHVAASDVGARPVSLGVSKSVVIDLPADIKDVLVADPKIANAVVRSARRAYIIGITVGETNVFFFDSTGRQIAGFNIAVTRGLDALRAAIHQAIPDGDIRLENVGSAVMLTGSVANDAESQQANDIASHFVDPSGSFGGFGSSNAPKVINALMVRGRDQVMLKVTVAEVERDLIKQLGIDLSANLSFGTAVVNFQNLNQFSALGQALNESQVKGGWQNISATLHAMEQAGVIHTLAEPSLTAISGETATFVAGGEFPVLSGYACSATTAGSPLTCQPSITFKNFGVSLNFTPVVLSGGRISLKVMTEVSDLSSNNAIVVAQPNSSATATVPSIRTRRADTTVELPSGGSLALAGMIQDSTRHNINGFPGLMQLPILGTLFKSNDYINQRTELMVLVTPYIVRAVASKDLSRPDDGFADPSDPAQVLLGRFNRIYGVGGKVEAPDAYHGKYGFILD